MFLYMRGGWEAVMFPLFLARYLIQYFVYFMRGYGSVSRFQTLRFAAV